jgi:hypothetical protein
MGVGEKLMFSVFKFMLFTSKTCKNFTELRYSITESSVMFSAAITFKPSSTFKQEHELCAKKFPLQPLVYGSLE